MKGSKTNLLIGIGLFSIVSLMLMPATQQIFAPLTCDDSNPISGEVVNDDVFVPAGEECSIDSSTINGNVDVDGDGVLDVFDFTTIIGDVIGTGPRGDIFIDESTVEGDVDVKGMSRVFLSDSTFGGNILVKELVERGTKKTSVSVFVLTNSPSIGGDVEVEKFTGQVIVFGNEDIDGSIKVKEIILELAAIKSRCAFCVSFNTVSENIEIEKISSGEFSRVFEVIRNIVNELIVEDNSADLEISENEVDEDLEVIENTGSSTEVTDNTAGNDAECEDNDNLSGSGNTAVNENEGCPE